MSKYQEIIALKTENDTKINNLVNAHITEIEELRKENIEFKHELQVCQELVDATLAKKDDEIKQGTQL